MKLTKKATMLTAATLVFLAYNTFDIVKAETTNLQEVSPFAAGNESSLTADDIKPAILPDINTEVKAISDKNTAVENSIKEEAKKIENAASSFEKTPSDLKIETNTVTSTETTKETVENVKNEANKDLPVLEDIKLPSLNQKTANNEPVKIEVSSQQIPTGTIIPVKLESPVNSVSSKMGDQFNATLTSDIIVNNNIVLPAGSVIRGTIGKMRKAGMFVREAKIMLIFDHIVTPAGKQVPLYGYMANSNIVNYEGYVTGGTSYSKAFKADATKGKEIVVKSTSYGVDKGLKYLAGAPVIITAPVCALGGALGGGGYIVGKSIYNIFNKGGEVILEQGTALEITLSKPLDIPVN